MTKQRTLAQPVSFQGIGLHTGRVATMTFLPADADAGFKFQRTDIEGSPIIVADVVRVKSTNRGTTIEEHGVQVHTVEHVLSAFRGLDVHNVLIQIDGPEVPIMDGSSLMFVEAIQRAGIVLQDADVDYLEIREQITLRDEKTGSEIIAFPDDNYSVTAMIDFNSDILGLQYAQMNNLDEYETQIAPNRTFVFLHELEVLLDQGLIKGGDLDNAVVIANHKVTDEQLKNLAAKLNKPEIKIEQAGVLNTSPLRFQNEPARHKLLDIIGDLALVGKPLKARIVATRPGHTINVEFAKLLRQHALEQARFKNIPRYDPTKPPIFDYHGIIKRLPHRYPFLMLDKVIELSDTHVVGIKNVTINEPFFQGHFPDNPVFPGVLQLEALAQTGGLLAIQKIEEGEKWDTYFLKIDNCRFKQKVLPGDTLILKMELLSPPRRGIFHMFGTIYVGDKLVSEAELTAQIVKRS
jgi:UDP-3-O-[3-hydroxymyristoyl] N-acetylglucosamine deacetylase/3-hydroxyacyl-[acyl-carrier-protein] dehydratase